MECQYNLLSRKMNTSFYEKICNDIINNGNIVPGGNIVPVTGGLRNKSFIYKMNTQSFFIKIYNEDTKYSRHMSECKCVSEYYINMYLYEHGCDVAKPLFYDERKQIGIYEYIDAKNLTTYKNWDMALCFKVMKSISKVHSVPVINKIDRCEFTELKNEDIYRYLSDGINFLEKLMNVNEKIRDSDLYNKIVEKIGMERKVFGNTQLHNGNVLVSKEKKVYLCDFEKTFPHFPQMDIMSFVNCRKFCIEKEKEVIDYYLYINNIIEKDEFYAIYNLLFIIDCLRILKKIKYNSDGLKVKWVEENGIRRKYFEKTDLANGVEWNKERGESIENRINAIIEKIYSQDPLVERLRNLVIDIVCKGKKGDI